MHSGNGVLNILDPDEERIHKLESRSEDKSEGSTVWQKDKKIQTTDKKYKIELMYLLLKSWRQGDRKLVEPYLKR